MVSEPGVYRGMVHCFGQLVRKEGVNYLFQMSFLS